MSLAARIHKLFTGYENAHGKYEIRRTNERGKAEGRAITVSGGATEESWAGHLDGSGAGIGIIPLCSDDQLYFAALDIDKYDLSFDILEDKIRALPLTICRSKSGGAHLYIFFKTSAPAREVVECLTRWAAEIGYGGCEVFPKQTYRVNEKDIGNWINMPYFNAADSLRYAYANGKRLTLEEFLDIAEERATTIEQILEASATAGSSELFDEGPPCLQTLEANGGFPEGTRNEGMFNTIVYLKRRWPENWDSKVIEYSAKMCQPPLGPRELHDMSRTHDKKEYGYRCKQSPIFQHCNRRVCQHRKFGVGETADAGGRVDITSLTKYDGDPVYWGVDLSGQRVIVDTDTLYSQSKFNKLCMEKINRCPSMMPQPRWLRYLDDKVKDADIIPAPEDASSEGQFWILFGKFAHGRVQAKREEELTSDKPMLMEGRVHFASIALFRYLNDQRFNYKNEHQVWMWLRGRGAVKENRRIAGKQINIWIIDAPENTKVEVPEVEEMEETF